MFENNYSIRMLENYNVPLDLENFPSTYLIFLNWGIFRIHYAQLSHYWLEMCDPECKYLMYDIYIYV